MYQIKVQHRDDLVEVLHINIPNREEAEYILSEIMLAAKDPLPKYYIDLMKGDTKYVDIPEDSIIIS